MGSFLETIDRKYLESSLQAFSNALGVAAYACDSDSVVTDIYGADDVVKTLISANADSAAEEGLKSFSVKKPGVYSCPTGLTEFAASVVVDGECIGSLIAGQVMIRGSEPDIGLSQEVASELELDFDVYCQTLGKLPNIEAAQAKAYAELLAGLAKGVSLSAVKAPAAPAVSAPAPVAKRPAPVEGACRASSYIKIKEMAESVNKNTEALMREFNAIKERTDESVETVGKTDTIIKYIQNITTQMTLLGFNASIEAKRVGAAGDGFNVIAQEVRKLAQQTSSQTQSIENVLNEIKLSINTINSELAGVTENLSRDVKTINNLKQTIDAENAG